MTTPDPEATALQPSDDVPFTPRQRSPDVQFAPGTIIAGRYRISSILGSGGMGEVYRADDTKLDQPVALKFLPARLARDPILLSRLHDEVRLGRQIAHPNVCRIYDIVEADGAVSWPWSSSTGRTSRACCGASGVRSEEHTSELQSLAY